MAAQFVVPAVFGFVGHQVGFLIRDSRGHLPFDLFLEDVREHLRVESSGLVAPGHGDVEVAHLVEAVHDREFREYLGVGMGDLVRLVDVDPDGGRRSAVDAQGAVHAGFAVVAQPGALVIGADAGRDPPMPQRETGFVVERRAVRGHAEIGTERQFVRIHRVVQVRGGVGVFEDQLLDARAFEMHRRLHRAAAVEPERPEQPPVAASVARAEHHVFGDGVFAPGLFEREIAQGREILIEDHRVVGVLVGSDRRNGEFFGVVAHRESVADGRPAVGAGIVVADLPLADDDLPVVHDLFADVGVGIAALVQDRERKGVVDAQSFAVTPLEFPAAPAQPLPVAFFTRVQIVEKAARAGVVARHGHPEVGR